MSDHYMVYVIRKGLGTQYNGLRTRRVRTGHEDQLLTDLRKVQWETGYEDQLLTDLRKVQWETGYVDNNE